MRTRPILAQMFATVKGRIPASRRFSVCTAVRRVRGHSSQRTGTNGNTTLCRRNELGNERISPGTWGRGASWTRQVRKSEWYSGPSRPARGAPVGMPFRPTAAGRRPIALEGGGDDAIRQAHRPSPWRAAPRRAVLGFRMTCTGTRASSSRNRPLLTKGRINRPSMRAGRTRRGMPPPR